MGAVKVESRQAEATEVPRLRELLSPCPICRGTTDIDLLGHAYCHSCRQEWTLAGKPIVEDNGATWRRPIGIGIGSSPEIESRLDTAEQPVLSTPIEFPLGVHPNYAREPVTENLDLASHAKGIRLKELAGRFQSLSRLISGIARKCLKKAHK